MRFLIAGLILALGLPAAEARSYKAQCLDRCASQYKFCSVRATTDRMHSQCKASRKLCEKQCRVK